MSKSFLLIADLTRSVTTACYRSDYQLETEDVCPDYIHPSLMDKVKEATTSTPAAYTATEANLSLPYDNSMGPYC
jgi:hypothetical protein